MVAVVRELLQVPSVESRSGRAGFVNGMVQREPAGAWESA